MNGSLSPSAPGRPLLDAAALPCGADVDLLLEQAAAGRGGDLDAHQRNCVHCQAALEELAVLWAPVADLTSNPVPAPPGLVAAVMGQIRTLAQDVWYTLEVTETGVIRIAARVVAAIARDSARLVPGVRVALGRSTRGKLAALAEKATLGHRHPDAAVGVLGRTAVVDLAVAVSYGDPVDQVARQIQQRVISALGQQTGLRSVKVNVLVDDVLDEE